MLGKFHSSWRFSHQAPPKKSFTVASHHAQGPKEITNPSRTKPKMKGSTAFDQNFSPCKNPARESWCLIMPVYPRLTLIINQHQPSLFRINHGSLNGTLYPQSSLYKHDDSCNYHHYIINICIIIPLPCCNTKELP
jgi:hypothetical protein